VGQVGEAVNNNEDSRNIIERDNGIYRLRSNGVTVNISQNDIIYISSSHNGSEIWTRNEVFKSGLSLAKWLEQLDEAIFIRAHKNCIVNFMYIDYIDDMIHMNNGEKVQLSRRNKGEVSRRFLQYRYDCSL